MAFKLKKMPSGMSYDEVRARQVLKEANASEENVPKEPADDPSSKPDSPEHSEAPVALTDRDDTDSPDAEADPDEIDTSVPEPEKRDADPLASMGPDADQQSSKKPENPDQPARENAPARSAISKPSSRGRPERTTIKGYSAQPARGVSATYDAIEPVYGDKAAMKHLLDVALRSFFEALEVGKIDRVQGKPNYPSVPKKHQVSRNISDHSFAILVEKIDPNGILKSGTVGRTIVQGALNHFIAEERRRQTEDAGKS